MPKSQEEKLQGFSVEEPGKEQVGFELQEKKEETGKTPDRKTESHKEPEPPESGFKIPKFRSRPTHIPNRQDPQIQQIEKILEQGLGDAYSRLSPIAKQEFKLKGEQTAIKINELLKATHVKVKKILKLIVEWLKLLPGVNRFFLEQEAKIKTDQILSTKKK